MIWQDSEDENSNAEILISNKNMICVFLQLTEPWSSLGWLDPGTLTWIASVNFIGALLHCQNYCQLHTNTKTNHFMQERECVICPPWPRDFPRTVLLKHGQLGPTVARPHGPICQFSQFAWNHKSWIGGKNGAGDDRLYDRLFGLCLFALSKLFSTSYKQQGKLFQVVWSALSPPPRCSGSSLWGLFSPSPLVWWAVILVAVDQRLFLVGCWCIII